MTWPLVASLQLSEAIPVNYELDVLSSAEVPVLINKLKLWYPDIVVGAESCHLDPAFYPQNCVLKSQNVSHDILPLVLKHQGEIVLFLSLERNQRAETITARLGSIDPTHRGMKLAYFGPILLEAYGRALHYGLAYYTATLKIPHQQRVAEKQGFQLVGILPAIDRDMVRPGTVRRVFEAVYAKILVPLDQLEIPAPENLTPQTQQLFNLLFPSYTGAK